MKETVQIQTPPCPEIREGRRSVRFSSHCPFFIGSQLSPLAAFLKRYMRASARLRVLCKLPLSKVGIIRGDPIGESDGLPIDFGLCPRHVEQLQLPQQGFLLLALKQRHKFIPADTE